MSHHSLTGRGIPFTVQANSTSYVDVPENVELWFDVRVLPESAPTTGDVMFGSAVLFQDGMCFPMNGVENISGDIAGFKIVGYAQLPAKTAGNGPPANCIVSFYGQCSCGKLGVVNGTDAAIQCIAMWSPRKLSTLE